MSVSQETPTMQVRTPEQIAKHACALRDIGNRDACEQAVLIALAESATGRRIDYVCNSKQWPEDVLEDLCPDYEIEESQCTSEAGNSTATERMLELVWSRETHITIDITSAQANDFIEPIVHVSHPDTDKWTPDSEITAHCKLETVGTRVLMHVSYEGVACG